MVRAHQAPVEEQAGGRAGWEWSIMREFHVVHGGECRGGLSFGVANGG